MCSPKASIKSKITSLPLIPPAQEAAISLSTLAFSNSSLSVVT